MPTHELNTDILIIGGGTGGCAAAMAAASLGRRVILTEETDWLGGQLTSQAVPPDENRWIEQFGCTRRYRHFRNAVRAYYRANYSLSPGAFETENLNPGGGRVSRICHVPRVAVAVIDEMLAYPRTTGHLRTLLRHKPVAADVAGDRVRAVTVRNLDTGHDTTISADYILDATELGDLLPLAKVEYVSGAESKRDTNEPHALDGDPDPDNVQGFTWCFAAAYDPDGNHVIDKPPFYDRWRDYEPKLTPPWPGKLLSWTYTHPVSLKPIDRTLFEGEVEGKGSFFAYRQIVKRDHHAGPVLPHDVTLVNWPQNDYWETNIIDKPQEVVDRALRESRELSLSLLYWLQTEAPRGDGGTGYPGLHLCPELMGTSDGLAKAPYVRESRRIRALFTVTENHIGTEARGEKRAEQFPDTVGIGSYRIDLHPSTAGHNYIDISSLPFQIPLGSLIPQRVSNLLAACKNLGVTHITNGCYRLHPVEWNIGESAGLLAAFCLMRNTQPHAVQSKPELLKQFQDLLRAQGVELEWPDTVTPV